jgi:thiol-disulfide isomerase/thioredoxin
VAARALDVAALALLALALWKVFVAPRFFEAPKVRAKTFTLPALAGGTYTLPAHPGRVVFLDFWASWCVPCRASLPLVERFAQDHPDVSVIAVDTGEPQEAGRAFAHQHGLNRVVFDTDTAVAGAFGVYGFPTLVVVDPAGFVRATWRGLNPAIAAAMDRARTSLTPAPSSAVRRP